MQDLFWANVRSARRGAAPGPSGMTADHVRPLLEANGDAAALSHAASLLARNEMPEEEMVAMRCGRITALQKPDGGVRGIVVGDIFRRFVTRTTLLSSSEPRLKLPLPRINTPSRPRLDARQSPTHYRHRPISMETPQSCPSTLWAHLTSSQDFG